MLFCIILDSLAFCISSISLASLVKRSIRASRISNSLFFGNERISFNDNSPLNKASVVSMNSAKSLALWLNSSTFEMSEKPVQTLQLPCFL